MLRARLSHDGTPGGATSEQPIYPFDHAHPVPPRDLTDLLGGKGAGLAEMTATLGLPVPPGFTITVPVSRRFRAAGWPGSLDDALREAVARLGATMGRSFGDAADPLLLAVRSGAPRSMPGMLDTVLNLGLNDDAVAALAEQSGDAVFAWDSYRRFLHMFATTVMGVPADRLPDEAPPSLAAVQSHVSRLRAAVEAAAGRPVPADPHVQLRQAVEAVFRSWDSPRARAYRATEGIDDGLGTAVNVQAMVFGNRGPDSGTGVVFTRDPATGRDTLYGDYLPRAQGEDVVGGTARTWPIARMAEHLPDAHHALRSALRRLETHYRDICDVEFTVEQGRLWLLQTRVARRGAVAAVRAAVQMTRDPEIALTPAEALDRVPAATRDRARHEVLDQAGSTVDATMPSLGTGLGVSPGRACGRVVLTSEDAVDARDDVVLVRSQTSPEDVAGMAAATGILTTTGGLVSHAAVVARGWGIPTVVGAGHLTVGADGIHDADRRVVARAGDVITIDGTTGEIWLGAADHAGSVDPDRILATHLPELGILERWAASHPGKEGTR
ncbi:pyruvate, phosphate dikinase [Xylanimonas allomyrinae]|uniref:Pyruvate, phosphate dikinase n=1 Tax=Xylanimonas allomyrinae TaxID=2509459 RepID=A0A4P6EKV7_9MICO|nr:pyruvate, phosphate dikinase [Xylanimonas allomyrinae]QAY62283.1 pyruvate, phosphate dikinase [Xylanimonas allomyrinae]